MRRKDLLDLNRLQNMTNCETIITLDQDFSKPVCYIKIVMESLQIKLNVIKKLKNNFIW